METPGRRKGVRKSMVAEIKDCVCGTAYKACPWVCISTAKYGFMPFSCARLMAGHTPALTHGAAKLAGPWNVTQAHFCGLAALPGEGAKRPLASLA